MAVTYDREEVYSGIRNGIWPGLVICPSNRSQEHLADHCLGTHSIDQAVVLFGRPKSVTGFFRAQRGIESEVEDSFTIILQYEGEQKDLLVTVKTSVTTPLAQQLKLLVRGTEGSYIKVSHANQFCEAVQG